MAIWFQEITLEDLNRFGKDTMSEFLGIQFIEIGDDTIDCI